MVVDASLRLRDAALFGAGLQLADDPAAGLAARVAGWQVVHAQLTGVYPAPTAPVLPGAPLPADRITLAREAATRAAASADTPPAVKELADELLSALDLKDQILRVCGPGGSIDDQACSDAVEADDAANP